MWAVKSIERAREREREVPSKRSSKKTLAEAMERRERRRSRERKLGFLRPLNAIAVALRERERERYRESYRERALWGTNIGVEIHVFAISGQVKIVSFYFEIAEVDTIWWRGRISVWRVEMLVIALTWRIWIGGSARCGGSYWMRHVGKVVLLWDYGNALGFTGGVYYNRIYTWRDCSDGYVAIGPDFFVHCDSGSRLLDPNELGGIVIFNP